MSTKFGENLTWFLYDVSCADNDAIEDHWMDIYGETKEGADTSCAVDLRELCGAAHDHIAELEAQQRWIPLSEKLPEYTKDTRCLVATRRGVVVDDWEHEYQEFEQTAKTATHWMPVPDPPDIG